MQLAPATRPAHRRGFRVLALLALATLFLEAPRRLEGQVFSPYSDFDSLTAEQLADLQVKLTFVGPQLAVVPSLAFTSNLNTFGLDAFASFQRPDISYANETIKLVLFSASVGQLEVMIDNVGTLPDVRAGGVAAEPYISFAMVDSQPVLKGFEAIVDKEQSESLFRELRESFAGHEEALRRLAEMACALDLLPPERPTDVTASTEVKVTGLRPDRHTGQFVGAVSVKNTSGSTFPAPLSLVLDLPGNVRLAQDDGTTCGTTPVGRQFVHLPIPPTGLPAGQTVTMTLQFVNPEKETLSPASFKVLAGPGAR